jgi:type I restriction enzyme R subunit
MPSPTEHKTVQARILAYAEAIGWTVVSREEAERRRGVERMKDDGGRVKNGSLFFDDLLDAKVREFNPRYAEAEGALLGQFPPSSSATAGQAGASSSTTRRSASAT